MGKPGKVKVKTKAHRAEVWHEGVMVALVEGANRKWVEKEIRHYAQQYVQDGPVMVFWAKPVHLGRR